MLSKYKRPLWTSVLAFAVLAVSPATEVAANGGVANNNGASVFFSNDASLLKKFPSLESVVPVPSIANPTAQKVITISCRIGAEDGGAPLKGARGNYRAELVVIDRGTGMSDVFPLQSGPFRTKRNGVARFRFDIPSAIFSDGFESGDVSAWSYARTDFKKGKGNFGALDCDATATKN